MRAPAKYLFDVDFGGGADTKPAISLAEHETKLAEAEALAYRAGVAAAETQALADTSRLTGAALARVADAFDGLDSALRGIEARLEAEAVEVAVAVARRLAPALIAREPFGEIAALVTECFRHLVAAPHVVVRVNDALYAAAREKLDDIVKASGFGGRLVVMAEPEIAPGDCRIEWADGGVNRDRAASEAAIVEAVARYVAARRNAATPQDSTGRSET
jgi:flagellar assembly protein FliH